MAITLSPDADAAAPPPPPPEPPIAAPPEGDGRVSVTVRLTSFHFEYLAARARQNGNTPERELESILRTFRAQHDTQRYGLNTAPTGPGQVAGTRRA